MGWGPLSDLQKLRFGVLLAGIAATAPRHCLEGKATAEARNRPDLLSLGPGGSSHPRGRIRYEFQCVLRG